MFYYIVLVSTNLFYKIIKKKKKTFIQRVQWVNVGSVRILTYIVQWCIQNLVQRTHNGNKEYRVFISTEHSLLLPGCVESVVSTEDAQFWPIVFHLFVEETVSVK